MVSKKALRICRSEQNKNRCNEKCTIYSVCVVKNKAYRDKLVSLIDYVRELNRFAENCDD